MKRIFVTTILFFILISSTLAIPRFALMTGAKCGACHTNPTGGQMRTEYGSSFSVDALPIAAHKDDEFTFNPKLTDNITIGGDFRTQFLFDFADNGTDGKGKTSFHAMTATLYGSIQLAKKIYFYYKQDFLNPNYGSYSGPEVYGLAKILPGNGYVKAGVFLPDYGWRLDDHTSYTRGGDVGVFGSGLFNNGLLFAPNYKDIGIEAGSFFGDLFVTAAVFNGTGDASKVVLSKAKAYTMKVEYTGKADELNFRIGASGYGFKSYKMGGIHAGLAYGDIVISGEVDWTHHRIFPSPFQPVKEDVNMMAAYAEVDYRAMQGLWFTGKFDMFDPLAGIEDDDLSTTNSLKRLTIGLEYYPFSFVELRPQYRVVMEKPSVDNDQALVQLHLWF
ncbi:MAG: hypothetical protein HY960_06205 [Ignavibacteriae bacterium]|nr:hypothetical protein [Ignavibacteriota bacterium]